MFAKKDTHTTPKIDPSAPVLYITDVSTIFDIKAATLRQYVSRGTMPAPSVRRSPELGWDAHDIYAWAYTQRLMPLAAIPFRHLRHVIDTTQTRGAPVPRVHSVATITQGTAGRHSRGVKVHYGGLTDESVAFTLYYPVEGGIDEPTPGQVGISVAVTSHVHPRGFFVSVRQAHPDYEYAIDTEVFTRDVAELVGEAIPYWPYGLRSAGTTVNRATGHVDITEQVHAQPDGWEIARGRDVEAFVSSPQGEAHPQLSDAMRASVMHTYRQADQQAREAVMRWVRKFRADSWALADPAKHLVLAATLADVPAETDEQQAAREHLEDLAWTVPVGDSPVGRQIAPGTVPALGQRSFPVESETAAQAAFRASLVPVPQSEATLTHLAFFHPKAGAPSATTTVPRTYWRDHYSGALVTIFDASESSPEFVCYAVPREWPEEVQVKAEKFDFTDERHPFVWAAGGAAVPYPEHPESGYSLGYLGSGPMAIMETTAQILGERAIDSVTPPATWPFYSPGYPTLVPAGEMRNYFVSGRD